MKIPRERLIAEAMSALGSAIKLDDLVAGIAALTDGLGLERYVVVDVRGGLVVGTYHNAPAEIRNEFSVQLDADPITARASVSRIPFLWDANTGGPWRTRHGDFGYRSGITCASWDASGAGCIAILSCTDERTPAEHADTLMAYSAMAAVVIGGTLRRLTPAVQVECPFTARELDCLLYALAGKSSKETARALEIEVRTVHQYLERARAKLGVTTSYAAATTALRNGWLDLQQASELAGLGPAASGTRKVGGL